MTKFKKNPESEFIRYPQELSSVWFSVPAELVRDNSISPETRCLIIYFLSHTHDYRDTKLKRPQVIREMGVSKDKFYKMLNEAMAAGYIKREIYHENNLKKYRYFYSHLKLFFRCPEFQDPENQDLEKQDSIDKQSKSQQRSKLGAAASASKIDPLKFEHEIYQNDKKLYDKVIEWYSRKYAKKAPKSKLAVLKSCIKEKWYEEEVEEAKQNDQERDLNVKFAREVEKRYRRTNRPSLSDFKALKSGVVFISGTKEVTIPSYDMPHEIFKKMIKDIFESRGIWEDLVKVKL